GRAIEWTSLSPNISQQFLPFAAFLFILLDGHTPLGVPALEIRLVHGAIETELAQKLLPLRAKQKISKQKSRMRMRRIRRQSDAARVSRHNIHGHPFDRRPLRDRYPRMAEKHGGGNAQLAGNHHVEYRPSGNAVKGYILQL